MRAAAYNRRIVVKTLTIGARDAMGHPTPTWTTQPAISAKRTDVSDGERMRAQGVGEELTTRFQVRSTGFTRSITVKDRIVHAGAEYQIAGIKTVETDGAAPDDLEITCSGSPHG